MLTFVFCTAYIAFCPSGAPSPLFSVLFTSTAPYRSQFSSFISGFFSPLSNASSSSYSSYSARDQSPPPPLTNPTGLPALSTKNASKQVSVSAPNKSMANQGNKAPTPQVTTIITNNTSPSQNQKQPDPAKPITPPTLRPTNNWSVEIIKDCDIFYGNWVKDDSYPLYPQGSCGQIDESFNCFLNGRPDQSYQKLRWQPYGCNIPRLNPRDMLERLRKKRLVFVGDSLNRNMWESLVCILKNSIKDKNKAYEVTGHREFRSKGSYSFYFKDYDCTVEFFQSHFLVQEWEMPDTNGSKTETLRLDIISRTASKYKDADVIIFNTGHWWTHEKTSKGEGYYQEGNRVYNALSVVDAYRKALKTWAKWVDYNINPKKSLVFFRGFSANHFKGGRWNSGGQCDSETEPIKNDDYLSPYPWKMKVLESVLGGMKTRVSYLNITRMTDYRKDAHPSVYRKSKKSKDKTRSDLQFQDCSHWCLPGVPDSWNEVLYAQILVRQYPI